MANTYQPPQPNQMRRFAEYLRSEGYSQQAITFAERGAVRTATPFMDPTRNIMNDAQSTVRQLKIGTASIDERVATIRSTNLKVGSPIGIAATTLIAAEAGFATFATEDAHDSLLESATVNTIRTALGTIGGFLIAKKKFGSGGVLAGTSLAVGTTQVTREEMQSLTDEYLTDLEEEFSRQQEQLEIQTTQAATRREDIRTTIDELRTQREDILSPNNSDALVAERDRINADIAEQEQLLRVYNTKAGTPEYDQYVAEGFTNVGINVNGIGGSDDDPYDAAVERLNELKLQLAPIADEIFKRASEAGSIDVLTPAQQEQISTIDARIDSLNSDLIGLDNSHLVQLQETITRLGNEITDIKAGISDGDESFIDELLATVNTQDGATAASSGVIFSLGSIAGGVLLHKAEEALRAGADPVVPRQAITILGVPVSSLNNESYMLRHHRELAEVARTLETTEGVDHALRLAESAHLNEYKSVLQEMYDQEIIPANRYQAIGQGLRATEEGLENAMQPWHRSAIIADISGIATEGANAARSFMSGVGEALAATQTAKLASKAASVGTSAPAIGVALGAGAGGALAYFSSSQKALAEELHAAGHIDDKALEEYVDMIDRTSAVYGTDIALSTGASFFAPAAVITVPFAIATTGGAEGYGNYAFQQFYDSNNLTHLPQEYIDTLSPSMIQTPTVETKFFENIRRHIPLTTEGQPESVHGVIEANAAFHDSMGAIPTDPFSIDPYNTEIFDNIRAAEQDLLGEMAQLGSTREGMEAFLDMFPRDERLKMVRRLSESESDSLEFSVRHPHIAQYATEYKDASLFNRTFRSGAIGADVTDSSINSYILKRLGMPDDPEPLAQITANRSPEMAMMP